MNPSKRYTWAIIKTIITQLTILGIIIFANIVFALVKYIPIIEQLMKINNPFFYYLNLISTLIIGAAYAYKAKKDDISDFDFD